MVGRITRAKTHISVPPRKCRKTIRLGLMIDLSFVSRSVDNLKDAHRHHGCCPRLQAPRFRLELLRLYSQVARR
jgi:hypothetical protein